MSRSLEEIIHFLEATTGLIVSSEGEIARETIGFLKELQRAREECARPILLRCKCGGSYERGEQDTMGRLEPFSQADVNIRWACDRCGHSVSSGPHWGAPENVG